MAFKDKVASLFATFRIKYLRHFLAVLAGIGTVLLISVFVTGMLANLYVDFGLNPDPTEPRRWALGRFGPPYIIVHAGLAGGLIFVLVVALIFSIMTLSLWTIIPAAIFNVGVIMGHIYGFSFIDSNGNDAGSSLNMSISFLVTFLGLLAYWALAVAPQYQLPLRYTWIKPTTSIPTQGILLEDQPTQQTQV